MTLHRWNIAGCCKSSLCLCRRRISWCWRVFCCCRSSRWSSTSTWREPFTGACPSGTRYSVNTLTIPTNTATTNASPHRVFMNWSHQRIVTLAQKSTEFRLSRTETSMVPMCHLGPITILDSQHERIEVLL